MSNLFKDQIPLLRPWLGREEAEAVSEVISSGWICQGHKVMDFEQAIADYIGTKYAVATNSCTASLHLTLIISGIEQGDEVICPSFTCMATANAIHHAGAMPKFVDIDPQTYNPDPSAVQEAITEKTKAILVVHQIGLPADIDAFKKVAKKSNLILIEDAATALGGVYKGKRVGSLGSPTCFSFHPRKMITTGEGGMITTDNFELAEKAKILRATGASSSDLERHKAKGTLVQQYFDVGYNYRMTDMQAALGLVQLKKIDKMIKQRAEQAQLYNEAFAEMDEIAPPYVPDYATHVYSSYMIRLNAKSAVNQFEFLEKMAKEGISCRIGIQPLHYEPFYKNLFGEMDLPNTQDVAASTVFLPIFPGLSEQEQKRIIQEIKKIC